MYVLIVTDLNTTSDFEKITDTNTTNDYNITDNCTINENNIDILIPTLLTIPGGISFVCLISLMVYTLIKPLIKNK